MLIACTKWIVLIFKEYFLFEVRNWKQLNLMESFCGIWVCYLILDCECFHFLGTRLLKVFKDQWLRVDSGRKIIHWSANFYGIFSVVESLISSILLTEVISGTCQCLCLFCLFPRTSKDGQFINSLQTCCVSIFYWETFSNYTSFNSPFLCLIFPVLSVVVMEKTFIPLSHLLLAKLA